MKDERPDVESALARLTPAPAPPGLRERVLARALEARRSAALTPPMRLLAAVCIILVALVIGIEPVMGRLETARLAALLDGLPPASPEDRPMPELAEALGGPAGGPEERLARFRAAAASAAREARRTEFFEVRERLKGWLDNETSEDLD